MDGGGGVLNKFAAGDHVSLELRKRVAKLFKNKQVVNSIK